MNEQDTKQQTDSEALVTLTEEEAAKEAAKRKKAKKKRRIIRRIIVTVIVLALLGGLGYWGYTQLKPTYTVSYTPYTASIGSISNSLSFSGTLQLIDNKTYTASSAGTVKTVWVTEGQEVQKGDRLLRLSTGETIEADFDGRVNKLSVKKDDEVAQGATLVQVADFKHMRVNLRVDEYDISQVKVGTACTVTVTSAEVSFPSKISSIDYISASNGNVAYYTAVVEITLNGDEGVYPGMQVTVTVPQEEADNVVVLKMDAITTTADNKSYVLKKDADGNYVQTEVTVGVSNGNYVEIKEGLSDGDVVYAETQETNSSGSLFSSLFGTTQMNDPSQGHGNRDMSNFDHSSTGGGSMPSGGNMPSGGGFGGGQQ